jgi:succinate-semialdehyde dehydrogenase/glutarate-semialdehyde dehydrogenase
MYIGGHLVDTAETREVVSPATGEVVGSVAWGGAEDAERALQAAADAVDSWAATPLEERAAWMSKLREVVVREQQRLREAVCAENGKTWEQSEEDYQSLVDSLEYYPGAMERFGDEELPDRDGSHEHALIYEPVGVAVAFIAWNFPLLNLAFKIGPAMAAGCPIVIKPSFKTPLAAYIVGELCHEIGLPAGVVNVVCGDDEVVGDTLSSSTIPALLTLIGSTATARRIMERGSSSIKRYSMELGGNAPVLVFPDADLDLAADIVAALKFGNAGQVCVTPNRVFVHEDVADAFGEKVVERATAVRVGHGPEGSVDMGPLIDDRAAARVGSLVDDAVKNGATVLAGGGRPADASTGSFFAPTVLTDVTPEMRVCAEEVFGPVISLMTFTDEDEGLAQANATDAGLTAYVFTSDADTAERCSRRLRFGEVQINGVKYAIDLPHGGIKQSGLGHDCSYLALNDYLAPKRVTRALL